MEDELDFLIEGKERSWRDGVSWSVILSVVVHIVLIVWVLANYHPVSNDDKSTPMSKYVVMMKQNSQQFTEAPGKAVQKAPINAPYSDANRKASTPTPTGDQPTKRPGEGGPLYTPPMPKGGDDGQSNTPSQPAPQQQAQFGQQPSDPSRPV
ncbi:MAG: hypothetical protein JWN02_743, partial [Acidobacteria bacterium]|nr:hypothetical protein [Acidobacteriota bacterium]